MPLETHVPAAVSGRRRAPGPLTSIFFRGFLLEHAGITVAAGPLSDVERAALPAPYADAVDGWAAGGLTSALRPQALEELPRPLLSLLERADHCGFVEVRYVDPDHDTSQVEAMLDAGLEDASAFATAELLEDRHRWLCFHVPRAAEDATAMPLLIGFQVLDAPIHLEGRYLDFDDPSEDGHDWHALVGEAGRLAEEVNRLEEGPEHDAAWARFLNFTKETPAFRELALPPALLTLYRHVPFLALGPVLHPGLELPGLAPLPWSPQRRNPGRFLSFFHDPPERYYLDARREGYPVLRRPLEGGTELLETGLDFDAWFAQLCERLLHGDAIAEPWRPAAGLGRPLEELSTECFATEPLWGMDAALFGSERVRAVHPDANERWVRPYAANFEPDDGSELFFARAVLRDREGREHEGMAGFCFEEDDEVEIEGFTIFGPTGTFHFGLGAEGEAVFLAQNDLERLRFEHQLPVAFEVRCGLEVLAAGEIQETARFDPDDDEDPSDWEGPSAYSGEDDDDDDGPEAYGGGDTG